MIDEKKFIEYIDAGHYRSADEKVFSENDVVNMIKKQPKVGEWIPVEKALPKNGKIVLVTVRWNEKENVVTIHTWGEHDKYCSWILAWQPLPKAYEVEDER